MNEPCVTRLGGIATERFVEQVLDAYEAMNLDAAGVPQEDRSLFALALSEVVTNIVQHAEGVDIRVDVTIEADSHRLTARVADDAPQAVIDWDDVSMPGVEAESGRGLALSQAALDELAVSYDRGNQWTLVRGYQSAPE